MATRKTAAGTTRVSVKKTPVKKPPAKSAPSRAATKPAVKASAVKAGAAPAEKKPKKVRVVRDSFTMPEAEYRKIAEIKAACLKAGLPVKKSEVLRAGLKALVALSPLQLKRALGGLEKVKTGRPKKH